MNPNRIEAALHKEFLSHRRGWWYWPLGFALAPAALTLLALLAVAVAHLVGIPVAAGFASLDFRSLYGLAHAILPLVDLWLILVTVLYLARPVHGRNGRGEFQFWKGVGLDAREFVTVRLLLVALLLPIAAVFLILVVILSLGLIDLVGLLVSGGAFLSSAASLLTETPTLAFLLLSAFLLQSLWLLPLSGGLLVCSAVARGGRGPGGHPLLLALLIWIGLAVLGSIVRPLGSWLALLTAHDPLFTAVHLDLGTIPFPMLVLNTVLGLALLACAAYLDGRPSS
jgi:hypothetical protein